MPGLHPATGHEPRILRRWSRGDSTFTEEDLRARLAEDGWRVVTYVLRPGTVFPPHSHPIDKIDAVLSGTFRLTGPGGTFTLTAGDAVFVPRQAVHRAEVVGPEPVVSLDCSRD
jgi:quercetin dioxygenase-like cupin family protein